MNTTTLLAVIAVAELVTGIGLLCAPSSIVQLLLGHPLSDGVSLVVGRVAGIALIAIGLICWLEKARIPGPPGLLIGLLTYNGAIPVLLIHGYIAYGTNGIGLWPVVALHVVFALWLAACLFHIGKLRNRAQ